MTDRLRTVLGAFRLTVRSAAPENVLSRLSRERVRFWDLRRDDDFTVTLTVRRRDIDRASQLIARTQGEITERTALGLPVVTRRLRRRWAFFAAAALVLASMQVVTDFVWHVDVAGNDRVPAEAIRRELAELGVGFGTWGFDIVPQDLKNRMLAEIPELEWLTVVRSGGLATAVVREREPTPEVVDRRLVTNLVAVRDCLITDVEPLSGQAVCAPGDTVRAGELLISGWMDLELCTRATRALGEVYGRTWHRREAVTPAETVCQTYEGETHRRYALVLGRTRINFYGDSGNWGQGCDKIITYHTLTLPGGCQLPVTLVEETAVERETEARAVTPAEAEALLTGAAEADVTGELVAGQVLQRTADVRRDGGVYRLEGTWECREMVAREVPAIQTESEGTTWQNESSTPSGSSS